MKKKVLDPNNIFYDEYEVKLNYRKDDGFWSYGHIEHVRVPLKKEELHKEKKCHKKAEKMVEEKYKGIMHQIISVTYC